MWVGFRPSLVSFCFSLSCFFFSFTFFQFSICEGLVGTLMEPRGFGLPPPFEPWRPLGLGSHKTRTLSGPWVLNRGHNSTNEKTSREREKQQQNLRQWRGAERDILPPLLPFTSPLSLVWATTAPETRDPPGETPGETFRGDPLRGSPGSTPKGGGDGNKKVKGYKGGRRGRRGLRRAGGKRGSKGVGLQRKRWEEGGNEV